MDERYHKNTSLLCLCCFIQHHKNDPSGQVWNVNASENDFSKLKIGETKENIPLIGKMSNHPNIYKKCYKYI